MNSTEEKRRIIHQWVAAIPAGNVATYGQIAKLAGLPGYARFVGATLRQLPANSTLPWYRVINASGRISFPRGSPAYLRQKERLSTEGIVVDQGRISLRDYRWNP